MRGRFAGPGSPESAKGSEKEEYKTPCSGRSDVFEPIETVADDGLPEYHPLTRKQLDAAQRICATCLRFEACRAESDQLKNEFELGVTGVWAGVNQGAPDSERDAQAARMDELRLNIKRAS